MSKTFKLNTPRFSVTRGCGGTITVIQTLAWRQLDIQLIARSMRGGRSEVGSMIERIRFERVADNGFGQGYQTIERDQVCPRSNK